MVYAKVSYWFFSHILLQNAKRLVYGRPLDYTQVWMGHIITLIESLALHYLNFLKRVFSVKEIISGHEIKTNFGD